MVQGPGRHSGAPSIGASQKSVAPPLLTNRSTAHAIAGNVRVPLRRILHTGRGQQGAL